MSALCLVRAPRHLEVEAALSCILPCVRAGDALAELALNLAPRA